MRRCLILVAATVGLALFVAPAALAAHRQNDTTKEQNCYGTQVGTTDNRIDSGTSGDGGHIGVVSCGNSAPDGNVTVAGDVSDGCAYVVAQGDKTNGPQADGYVGVEIRPGGGTGAVKQVGPAEGEYNHAGCTNS